MNVLQSKQELVTLDFGNQTLKGNPYYHTGKDFVKVGYAFDNIVACARGKVINVEKNIPGYKSGSYGNFVHIQHNGNVSTVYAHMKMGTVSVNIGDIVEEGQVIGYMGATGFVTGAHLHFEVRENNVAVNPNPYFNGEKIISPYVEVPAPTPVVETFKVRVEKAEANVRKEPNSKAAIVSQPNGMPFLVRGDIFVAVGLVIGEDPYRDGRNQWYKSAKGNYVWAHGLRRI